jgi:hypothetical protein
MNVFFILKENKHIKEKKKLNASFRLAQFFFFQYI